MRCGHVAAEIEDHVVTLAVTGGVSSQERPLLGEEILGELDLAKVLRVIECHASTS
jgi:hypothetical protein